jgi:hypothetical protein
MGIFQYGTRRLDLRGEKYVTLLVHAVTVWIVKACEIPDRFAGVKIEYVDGG